VTDLGMPGSQGLELLRTLRRKHPELRLLVFSQHREEETGLACLKAGADGFLNKGASVEEIQIALRTVAGGRRYLSSALMETLVESAPLPPPHHGLSERELAVLCGLADGQRIGAIAEGLGINPKTVHTYRSRIMSKLGARTNVDLVLYAVEHDLLQKGRASAG
jgi:DNA-binding NarL/FixJ family response regulator